MTYNQFSTNQGQGITFTQLAQTGGIPVCFKITNAVRSAMTASTEAPIVDWGMTALSEWSTGALSVQRFFKIRSGGIAFTAPSTVDYAATFTVVAGPYQRTNATITNSAACWHDSWPANNATASMMVLGTPGIETGTGNVTERAALTINGWATTGFGDQIANIANIYGIKLSTYLINSTTNVRTITGNLAQFYIAGLPTLGGNISFSGTSYAIFVDAGPSRFDDHLHFGDGVAVIGTLYSVGRDVDGTNQLHLNVPTGAGFEFSVNDVAELTLNTTTLNLQTNTITGIGSAITGTALTALTISTPNSTGANAGTDITLKAGAASTSGAGGHVILWPGAAAGAGQPGVVQVYSSSSGTQVGAFTSSGAGKFSIQPAGGISNIEFSIGGSSAAISFNISMVSSAVNYVQVAGATTGNNPSLIATGSDTNVSLILAGKGTGAVHLGQATSTEIRLLADQPIADSSGNEYIKFSKAASAVNEVTIANAATTAFPSISATGGDTNIHLKLLAKGTGNVIQTGTTTATPNADLAASQLSFYLNEGGNLFTVKVKYSDGTTVKTGTVVLA